jgi:hypothetical protein
MITKRNTTTGYGWKLTMGIGLVGVTAVLIAAIMFVERAGISMTATSLALPANIRTLVANLGGALGFGEMITPMQSAPLGIDLPRGADVHTLPHGLTDYIRPSTNAQAVRFQAISLGIELPAGTNLRELPQGLTDYVRPQPAELVDVILGIALPYGTDTQELPAGLRDYIRADARPAPAAVASAVLGIDLPSGATRGELPSGLTDYLRPAQAVPHTPVPAVSSVLGITLPPGTNARDLPDGIRDYLRSDRSR